MFDANKAHIAQRNYCEEHKLPHFAPGQWNGFRCSRCNQNIYSEHGHPAAERLPRGRVRLSYSVDIPGISVERAGSDHICGCPFCSRSFDD